MSIFATWLTIEDERQWVAALESEGIQAGVLRDGEPDPDDFDAPLVYQGSHVLPGDDAPRGGCVEVAAIPGHVRYWRENPDAPVETEPVNAAPDPYLRLGVLTVDDGDATVLLTERQVTRLHDTLAEWLAAVRTDVPA